jgi:hypothetical protein
VDGEGYAEKLISEALARGELAPMEGVGAPLRRLDHDPDWWVKALVAREALPERRIAMERRRAALLSDSVAAPDLATARARLAEANAEARRWNAEAPASSRVEELDEIWLLDRRAGRPTDRPGAPGGDAPPDPRGA